MGNYLAFDLGASSGRAIVGRLGNGRLELQEVHRFANAPEEIDGSIYWNYPRLCAELKTGLRRALEVESSLDGIAIDTWGVDYVLFDRDTHAMKRLPYHYRDHRTEAAAHKLWRQLPPAEIYKMTGIQLMTLNTIYQLAAHRDEHPEDFENSVFLDIPDALALAFGGEFTTEYTHASTTNLLDPISRDWHWGLIDRIGLPRSIFPSIVSPCTRGGTLSAELQKELGCGPIPIIKIGSHDTASAVAAVPAPEAGNWAYLCTGTWALLGAELPTTSPTRAAWAAPSGSSPISWAAGCSRKPGAPGTKAGCSSLSPTWKKWRRRPLPAPFSSIPTIPVSPLPATCHPGFAPTAVTRAK